MFDRIEHVNRSTLAYQASKRNEAAAILLMVPGCVYRFVFAEFQIPAMPLAMDMRLKIAHHGEALMDQVLRHGLTSVYLLEKWKY